MTRGDGVVQGYIAHDKIVKCGRGSCKSLGGKFHQDAVTIPGEGLCIDGRRISVHVSYGIIASNSIIVCRSCRNYSRGKNRRRSVAYICYAGCWYGTRSVAVVQDDTYIYELILRKIPMM